MDISYSVDDNKIILKDLSSIKNQITINFT